MNAVSSAPDSRRIPSKADPSRALTRPRTEIWYTVGCTYPPLSTCRVRIHRGGMSRHHPSGQFTRVRPMSKLGDRHRCRTTCTPMDSAFTQGRHQRCALCGPRKRPRRANRHPVHPRRTPRSGRPLAPVRTRCRYRQCERQWGSSASPDASSSTPPIRAIASKSIDPFTAVPRPGPHHCRYPRSTFSLVSERISSYCVGTAEPGAP
jgi:hypothetical protein